MELLHKRFKTGRRVSVRQLAKMKDNAGYQTENRYGVLVRYVAITMTTRRHSCSGQTGKYTSLPICILFVMYYGVHYRYKLIIGIYLVGTYTIHSCFEI